MKPLISVVIPTFNRAESLRRALKSVFAQSVLPYEVIVVDDGSTDETPLVVTEFPVRYYSFTENSGVSRARNFGISLATGDWIALLDSDDEWLPKKLEKQIQILKPESTLIHGEEIWVRKGSVVVQKDRFSKTGGWIFEKCLPLCCISPSATLFKKSTFQELGGFDESYVVCEDYDLWLRWTSLYSVDYVETPIIRKFGGHGDQLSMKYHSMDFWRIQSMDRIKRVRSFPEATRNVINQNIVTKAEILIEGSLKHKNPSLAAIAARWYQDACRELGQTPKIDSTKLDFLHSWDPGPVSPQARNFISH